MPVCSSTAVLCPVGVPNALLVISCMHLIHCAGKLWMIECDLRTALADSVADAPYRFDTATLASTCDVLRRIVWASAMNGNGLYLYDLSNEGWFGRPANLSAGRQIWRCISQAVDSLQTGLANDRSPPAITPLLSPPPTPPSHSSSPMPSAPPRDATSPPPHSVVFPMQPQHSVHCVIFIDELATLHWPLSGPLVQNGTVAARTARKEWIHALMQQVMLLAPSLGTPLRIHLLSDLLQGALDLRHIRLAIFANAYRVTAALQHEIQTKLRAPATNMPPTTVFFHAPGLIDGDTGRFVASGPTDLIGAPMRLHSGFQSGLHSREMNLDTLFAPPPAAELPAAAPDLSRLHGQSYTSLSVYMSPACPGCPTRVGGITAAASAAPVSPWLACEAVTTPAVNCTVLGRGRTTGVPLLCWCNHGSHRTLFSASPGLPLPAWSAIVRAAGVHVWAAAEPPQLIAKTSEPEDVGVRSGGRPLLKGRQQGTLLPHDSVYRTAYVEVADLTPTRSIVVARLPPKKIAGQQAGQQAMGSPQALRTQSLDLPRAARVVDAATGLVVCECCRTLVDPQLTQSSRTYIADWIMQKAAPGGVDQRCGDPPPGPAAGGYARGSGKI